MELNPNNPIVVQAREHWHKIAALIMVKLGLTELRISPADLEKLAGGNVNIVLDGREEKATGELVIRIVDNKTAAELARQSGGRLEDN